MPRITGPLGSKPHRQAEDGDQKVHPHDLGGSALGRLDAWTQGERVDYLIDVFEEQ